MILDGCVQWNLVCGWKDFRLKQDSNPGLLEMKASGSPTDLLAIKSDRTVHVR